jgi:hypothetical protein
MSLTGNVTAEKLLRGKISGADVIYVDTYQLAVQNGYRGTFEEWLTTLCPYVGENGNWWVGGNDTGVATYKIATARLSSVTLESAKWTGTDNLHSQVVNIENITEFSKVDLLPSVEQLAIFESKNVTFVTENEDGVVTVFAIGDKPTQNYTMQVSITEVEA